MYASLCRSVALSLCLFGSGSVMAGCLPTGVFPDPKVASDSKNGIAETIGWYEVDANGVAHLIESGGSIEGFNGDVVYQSDASFAGVMARTEEGARDGDTPNDAGCAGGGDDIPTLPGTTTYGMMPAGYTNIFVRVSGRRGGGSGHSAGMNVSPTFFSFSQYHNCSSPPDDRGIEARANAVRESVVNGNRYGVSYVLVLQDGYVDVFRNETVMGSLSACLVSSTCPGSQASTCQN